VYVYVAFDVVLAVVLNEIHVVDLRRQTPTSNLEMSAQVRYVFELNIRLCMKGAH